MIAAACRPSWVEIPMPRLEHKLAAIVSADVAGYARLVDLDEEGTIRRLREYRRHIVSPRVDACRGRIVKLMGDSALAEFPSATEAVVCSVEIQAAIAEAERDTSESRKLRYRIGINFGDVIIEPDGDLMGDAVNVAARVEALAEPGGLLITGAVLDRLGDELARGFEFLGPRQLKNMSRPVPIYRLRSALRPPPRWRRVLGRIATITNRWT